MRRVLVERGAGARRIETRRRARSVSPWTRGWSPTPAPRSDLVALDDALSALAQLDARQARIVELRFFGGLTVEETAAAVGVSPATVKRGWTLAKAWLKREMETGRVGGS